MFPKYHSSNIWALFRDVRSGQLSPSQGCLLLFVQPEEISRQLPTCCCGCGQRSPPGGWEETSAGGSSIQASRVALSQGGSASLYLPTQGLFCVARQKRTMGTSSLLEVTSTGKYKASFWKLSHWTPCHPKNLTWIHFLTTTGDDCPFL